MIQITSPANFPKISTNDSTQNHPHQSIFFDNADFMTLGQEINEGAQMVTYRDSNIPELSSITLKKKLYNTRLQNKPEDLQQIVSGTLKDITDISKLLLSLNKYRAETMNVINSAMGQIGQDAPVSMSDQGILGQKPDTVRSIAELMLQDSDTNVYEDRNVELPQTTVFKILGKDRKVYTQKEKNFVENKRRAQVQAQLQQQKQKEKEEIIKEQAPVSMMNNRKPKNPQNTNDMLFVRQNIEDVEINFKEDLDEAGPGGLDNFFKQTKQRKEQAKA